MSMLISNFHNVLAAHVKQNMMISGPAPRPFLQRYTQIWLAKILHILYVHETSRKAIRNYTEEKVDSKKNYTEPQPEAINKFPATNYRSCQYRIPIQDGSLGDTRKFWRETKRSR